MKYCIHCGNHMEDNAVYCSMCGKFTKNKIQIQDINKANKSRKGMKILSIICFIFAIIYFLLSLIETSIIAFALFFGILSLMFLILSKSPKNNSYILNMHAGIKKPLFVLICIILSFASVIIVMSTQPTNSNTTNSISSSDTAMNNDTVAANDKPTNISEAPAHNNTSTHSSPTLEDIKKWYENQIPRVTQDLIEYSSSVNGLSNINITQSEFRFGEDSGWYDCHYIIYFTCKVNGELCTGEARGFMEYGSSDISWFHYEIFRDADWATIVEHYDDSYDLIIENYYKELIEEHK